MEWTRIEAKWHDMARRLQQGYPSLPSTTDAAIDAVGGLVSRIEGGTGSEPLVPVADDVIPRAEV